LVDDKDTGALMFAARGEDLAGREDASEEFDRRRRGAGHAYASVILSIRQIFGKDFAATAGPGGVVAGEHGVILVVVALHEAGQTRGVSDERCSSTMASAGVITRTLPRPARG